MEQTSEVPADSNVRAEPPVRERETETDWSSQQSIGKIDMVSKIDN